jgi:hypothetical protein
MPTLRLIQEGSTSCPVSSSGSTSVSLPLVLVGAVGVLAIVGIVAGGGNKSDPRVG